MTKTRNNIAVILLVACFNPLTILVLLEYFSRYEFQDKLRSEIVAELPFAKEMLPNTANHINVREKSIRRLIFQAKFEVEEADFKQWVMGQGLKLHPLMEADPMDYLQDKQGENQKWIVIPEAGWYAKQENEESLHYALYDEFHEVGYFSYFPSN